MKTNLSFNRVADMDSRHFDQVKYDTPLRISFLIHSLSRGGAEVQLMLLAKMLSFAGHEVSIVTMKKLGELENELEGHSIQLFSLNSSGLISLPLVVFKLINFLNFERVSVLYSFMPESNIVASFVKIFIPHITVLWGHRSSGFDLKAYGFRTQIAYKLEPFLSAMPDLIITNSYAGAKILNQRLANKQKVAVIHNGIDLKKFSPTSKSARPLRKKWQIPETTVVIGFPARFDPVKDHRTFIIAAASILKSHHDIKFVIVGDGNIQYRREVQKQIRSLDIGRHTIFGPALDDMVEFYNAVDIITMTSLSEGFPNVLGEAMACGVPCVSTDVGDARSIIGDDNLIVPVGDDKALVKAWIKLLNKSFRAQKAKDGLKRVRENFSDKKMATNTLEIIRLTESEKLT